MPKIRRGVPVAIQTEGHAQRFGLLDLDHLIDQLRNPQIEAELADAAWYAARKEIYERDPKNYKYNTRLG